MNEQEYLQQRLDDQLDWYDGKSGRNQANYKILRSIELVTAAMIPLSAAVFNGMPWFAWLAAGLGAIIAIASAINGLFRFQDNWIQYRTTAEQLKHEKFLFLTRIEPYSGDDAFTLLVQRVEGLIAKETSSWAQTLKKDAEQKADKGTN